MKLDSRRIMPSEKAWDDELRLVASQLWPAHHPSESRLVDASGSAEGWTEIERHWAIGRYGRVDMLLPTTRLTAARALASYSRLRDLRGRAARIALARGVALGLIPMRRFVVLRVRSGSATSRETVLQQLRSHMGGDLQAVMHVRRTANRKALLQIVNGIGGTVGYAKIGRNSVTSAGVDTEIATLGTLRGGSERVRVPKVVASGSTGAFPYLVMQPLPLGIRTVTSALGDTPSIMEFAAISPVHRWAPPRESLHVRRLRVRASQLPLTDLRGALDDILATLVSVESAMPIAERTHGDFAFWNVGRTSSGVLWTWDFENSEPDALAGIDVVHWHASRRRVSSGAPGVADRDGILQDSTDALRAFGAGQPEHQLVIYLAYVAEILARTLEAVVADGWSRVWCNEQDLRDLVAAAMLS